MPPHICKNLLEEANSCIYSESYANRKINGSRFHFLWHFLFLVTFAKKGKEKKHTSFDIDDRRQIWKDTPPSVVEPSDLLLQLA